MGGQSWLRVKNILDVDAKAIPAVASEEEAPTFFGVAPVPFKGALSLSIVAKKRSTLVPNTEEYKY